MKILAISDRIDEEIYSPAIEKRFGDVGLVLACGDLPVRYLEFIVTKLDVPLLYVFGNHDQGTYTANGQFKAVPAGCTNLDEQVVEVKGLLIGGLEGSMCYSDRGNHQFTEGDMRLKALRMFPKLWRNRLRYGRFLDILVTHAPPWQIHDGTDLCHTGFQTFRWMIEFYRPRYLVHGHLHVYDPNTSTCTMYRETQVVNAYRYQEIEWEEQSGGRVP